MAAAVWAQLGPLAEIAGAMMLGGLIGWEREMANRPAGFRTHMMVAGACAFFVSLGSALLEHHTHIHADYVSADPFRLLGGVVAALGFVGAGTIFRRDDHAVEGLTTASSLLFAGAIGVAAALQQWALATGATALALFVLYFVRRLENWITREKAKERA